MSIKKQIAVGMIMNIFLISMLIASNMFSAYVAQKRAEGMENYRVFVMQNADAIQAYSKKYGF